MGLLGDIAGAAGTAIGIASKSKASKDAEKLAKQQAKALKEAAKANKEISLYDAAVAEKSAAEAKLEMERNIVLHFRMADQLLGQQRTSYAKGGAVTSTGTPIDNMHMTMQRLQEDAGIIKYEGQKAIEARKSLAQRYRMLADAGMRDAAAQANIIEETGKYQGLQFKYQAYKLGLDYIGDILK